MKKILFVEDDSAIIECYTDIFRMLGFEILTAENAEETLEIYNRERGTFHAIIIDIGLPSKSGVELAEIIKKDNPDQRIVLTSGYTFETLSEHDRVTIARYGDIRFLTKPFASSEILKALEYETR